MECKLSKRTTMIRLFLINHKEIIIKNIVLISSIIEYVMFWTLLKQKCLDKVVLDIHEHNHRNLVETQKGESHFFFNKA